MRTTLSVIVVVLLFGAGIYYCLVDPYMSRLVQARVGDMIHAAAIPDDLADVSFLLTPSNGGGIYHDGNLAYDEYRADGSLVTDLAKTASVEAKTIYQPTTERSVVSVNGEIVISSSSIKKSLALSPEGSRAAVAVLEEDAWSIVVVNLATQETTIVPGTTVTFLDEETIVAFREDGAYAVTYATGVEKKIIDQTFPSPRMVVARSSDGNRLALAEANETSQYVAVYELDYIDTTWVATEIMRIPYFAIDVAVTLDSLYVLARSGDNQTSLLRYLINQEKNTPEVIRIYPGILTPAKVVL